MEGVPGDDGGAGVCKGDGGGAEDAGGGGGGRGDVEDAAVGAEEGVEDLFGDVRAVKGDAEDGGGEAAHVLDRSGGSARGREREDGRTSGQGVPRTSQASPLRRPAEEGTPPDARRWSRTARSI